MVDELQEDPLDEEARRLDELAFVFARGDGRARLRVGQGLRKLGAGFKEFGFARLSFYARERMGCSGFEASEARALAERLEELPRIRAALERGELSWSMADVLSRKGTADNEASLLGFARGKSVRRVRAALLERERLERDAADESALDAEDELEVRSPPIRPDLTEEEPVSTLR